MVTKAEINRIKAKKNREIKKLYLKNLLFKINELTKSNDKLRKKICKLKNLISLDRHVYFPDVLNIYDINIIDIDINWEYN